MRTTWEREKFSVHIQGRSQCHYSYLANPFRVLCEEELQGVKFLRYTLDVIQAIDTNDGLYSIESLLELLDSVDY